ncbi:MAG: DNA-3-methyladenine glycosylase [Deltaproteobacteria bacterium]|nr:DNA-3-methyladenine glycosylase [Deltaproteobacteria bacterium]
MPARRAPISKRLSRRFYSRDAPVVARALLGKRLVHGRRSGLIVETEAYLGPEDAASHARFGSKKRNAVMFGLAGVSYVYLCYGVHEMFNVVTGREGDGQAVLIRALAVDGQPSTAGRGPGKLTRALGLDRGHNAIDLTSNRELFLAPGRRVGEEQVASSPRIGVAYAGDWANRPLRFFIADHPSVSGRR